MPFRKKIATKWIFYVHWGANCQMYGKTTWYFILKTIFTIAMINKTLPRLNSKICRIIFGLGLLQVLIIIFIGFPVRELFNSYTNYKYHTKRSYIAADIAPQMNSFGQTKPFYSSTCSMYGWHIS